jgi:RNA ligase
MQKPTIDFVEFPKIARYSRDIVITEKIDGTNAQIYINDTMTEIYAGSRTKWITPEDDNAGFARWVEEHKEELLLLGPGSHFGEWWGRGIQRGYNLKEKRFSLFNVSRWDVPTRPACCGVVPTLYKGMIRDVAILDALVALRSEGSRAAPGFMKPEGIVIYHVAANQLFKKTLDKDESPKGIAK